MGNEPQTLTEMPLWVLILLAALGGVSGEMWRADKAGLGGWALLRRLALRSGASIVCGVAVMLLALACGAALLFAAALTAHATAASPLPPPPVLPYNGPLRPVGTVSALDRKSVV